MVGMIVAVCILSVLFLTLPERLSVDGDVDERL